MINIIYTAIVFVSIIFTFIVSLHLIYEISILIKKWLNKYFYFGDYSGRYKLDKKRRW